MKKSPILLGVSALALAVPCALGVNIISDAGFESGVLTFEGPTPNWTGFADAATNTAEITGDSPRTGSFSLDLATTTAAGFTGAFNDVNVGSLVGTVATFSGFHQLVGDAGGTEIRIEWRDSVADVEVGRTDNLTPTLTSGADFEMFSISDTVPVGADTGRAVYVIQTFGTALNQNVFVDDVSFDVVPEPSGVALLGLTALGLITRRRR